MNKQHQQKQVSHQPWEDRHSREKQHRHETPERPKFLVSGGFSMCSL